MYNIQRCYIAQIVLAGVPEKFLLFAIMVLNSLMVFLEVLLS